MPQRVSRSISHHVQVIEYLKNNPEAAKESYTQAQQMMQVCCRNYKFQVLRAWQAFIATSFLSSPNKSPTAGFKEQRSLKKHGNTSVITSEGEEQISMCLQNPGMAQQMIGLQSSAAQATPEQREKLTALKADPELKIIFDDIEQHGPGEFLTIAKTWTANLKVP